MQNVKSAFIGLYIFSDLRYLLLYDFSIQGKT